MIKTICKYKVWIILILVMVALDIFFFRNIIFTADAFGDYGDGRYCNLVTEHWYQFIIGNEKIGELSTFYPIKNSLGYSDTFIGFALPYIIIRLLGNDMFSAFKITIVVIHFIGCLSALYFCIKKMRLNYCTALITTIIFAYSNMQNTATHPQFYVFYYIPIFTLFIWGYFENINNKKKRIIYALAAITIFAVIFYTTGYIGYFMVIFMVFEFIIVGSILYIVDRKRIFEIRQLKSCITFVKRNYLEYCLFFIYTILIFVPFIILYLPIQQKNNAVRQWTDIMCPTLVDFINIAPSNLLWGKLLQFGEGHYAEFQTGFPIVTISIFAISVFYLLRKGYIKLKKNKFEYTLLIMVTLAISTICCFMLILKINTYSLWYFVFKLLPGASAIRAVTRFNQVLVWPLSLVIGFTINNLKIKRIKYLQYVLLVVFVLEYTWIGGITSMWNTDEPRKMLSKISTPPSDCEVIYIINDDIGLDEHDYTRAHLDAWMIAYKYRLRTINGYGSYYPKDWIDVNYTRSNLYDIHSYNWGRKNNISGFYAYDLNNDIWIKRDYMPEFEYISDSVAMQNSEYINNEIVLYKNGIIYGPYITLYPGEYEIEIKGNNLFNAKYYCSYNMGKNLSDINVITYTDNNIIYKIQVTEILENVEFPIKNLAEENIVVSSIKVKENKKF